MPKMTNLEYVEEGGEFCPECRSGRVSSTDRMQTDFAIAWQEIRCLSCCAKWTDQYKLVGYTQEEEA